MARPASSSCSARPSHVAPVARRSCARSCRIVFVVVWMVGRVTPAFSKCARSCKAGCPYAIGDTRRRPPVSSLSASSNGTSAGTLRDRQRPVKLGREIHTEERATEVARACHERLQPATRRTRLPTKPTLRAAVSRRFSSISSALPWRRCHAERRDDCAPCSRFQTHGSRQPGAHCEGR